MPYVLKLTYTEAKTGKFCEHYYKATFPWYWLDEITDINGATEYETFAQAEQIKLSRFIQKEVTVTIEEKPGIEIPGA